MFTTSTESLNTNYTLVNIDRLSRMEKLLSKSTAVFIAVVVSLIGLAGCGTGGYAGGGIVSLSSSAITIDAGQTFTFTATLASNPIVTWSLAGSTCSGSTCGVLSNSTGVSVTYTAPAGITSQVVLTLTGAVTGTTSLRTATITVNPDPTISGTPPAGTTGVAYTTTLTATPGTSPLTWSLVSGTLPAGLTFNTTTGVISGTPTAAGTSNFVVQIVDSSNVPFTVTAPETIVISSATAAATVVSGNPPAGVVNSPYSTTLTATGGVAPYTWSVISGTLPAGLTIGGSTGVISGTPTLAGTSAFTVQAQDADGNGSGSFGITIVASPPSSLSLSITSLPSGIVGTPYSNTIGVTGGNAPYTCLITAGTLQAGLTLTGCIVHGTPTVAGTVNLTVMATDSSSPIASTTGPVSLTIVPTGATIAITSPPGATINVPYTGTIGTTGGTAPYTCTITAGSLPTGLTATNCVISGTPTVSGSFPITVGVTDSSSPVLSNSGPVTITVAPASPIITLGTLPNATVAIPYTGTVGVSGGTAPYSCIITGTLPAGLTASGCVVSGTPTTAGTATLTVKATDSSTPVGTITGPVSLTVLPIPPLTLTGSLPNAVVNVPYTQTLHAAGGVPPYTYALTAGSLPTGITLSTTGVISGTPTVVGASSFTVTATDTETTPQTASLPLVLLVTYATTPNDAELKGPYAYLFQGYDDVLAGVLAYQTASAASFTADGTGVISGGELDANHQTSAPAGNTIGSNTFIGSYEIGTDSRGLMTITTFNSDGSIGTTSTYAISLKAPVAPAVVSTQGDLIEYDNNELEGTRGSGSLLAQTAAAFTTGLNGSYAFGMEGDTPCLPACTVGIIAGPAAAVGQFTANGSGLLTAGTSDANIATTNYASEALTGNYGTADGNGRLKLTMATTGLPVGVYPTDYVVYIVDASHAFVLSADKHSSYILLAGSAQLQTQASFSNASMSGPFVGYENTASNPGLLGAVLSSTLNFSTATAFRGTGNAAGTCDITNVDTGGLTALVNGLTGLGSSVPILNALLGTYQSTGTSVCTVATDGRGVLNYPAPSSLLTPVLVLLGLSTAPPPARIFYLVGPNHAYFLETGYAGLGDFELQTGAPFTLATLDGTYVYGTAPASSLASINSSGTFTANGAGHETTVADENIGVGTLNVLELGVTTSANYTLTDATAGRYLLGTTTVIYAINPDRFVLVDTNPLTTSPSIALLY